MEAARELEVMSDMYCVFRCYVPLSNKVKKDSREIYDFELKSMEQGVRFVVIPVFTVSSSSLLS